MQKFLNSEAAAYFSGSSIWGSFGSTLMRFTKDAE